MNVLGQKYSSDSCYSSAQKSLHGKSTLPFTSYGHGGLPHNYCSAMWVYWLSVLCLETGSHACRGPCLGSASSLLGPTGHVNGFSCSQWLAMRAGSSQMFSGNLSWFKVKLVVILPLHVAFTAIFYQMPAGKSNKTSVKLFSSYA